MLCMRYVPHQLFDFYLFGSAGLRTFAYFTSFKLFLYFNSSGINYSINIIKCYITRSMRLSRNVLIIASIIFKSPLDCFLFTYVRCSLLSNSLYFSTFQRLSFALFHAIHDKHLLVFHIFALPVEFLCYWYHCLFLQLLFCSTLQRYLHFVYLFQYLIFLRCY